MQTCGKAMLLGLSLLLLGFSAPILAQTFTTLHNFKYAADGGTPWSVLTLSGSTLYGTTVVGGISGHGTVFKLNADGTGFAILHDFTVGSPQEWAGGEPHGGLNLSGSTLYGTAVNGGTGSYGTVFKVNVDGMGFTILHSCSFAEANPYAGLILSGSTLYGTAHGGSGPGNGGSSYGAVFAVNTDGTGFTTVHSFSVPTSPDPSVATNSDGTYPIAGLILLGSRLFGTALGGGSSSNGTVFAVNTNGTGFTILHSFTASGAFGANSDGAKPTGGLISSGNILYGTTQEGGSAGVGTVFAINTDGTGFTTLHSFDWNTEGGQPRAGLILSGNTLYGTARNGGSGSNGTVFAVNTDGTAFTILHTFTGIDGQTPEGGLILAGNTLYGSTNSGGAFGVGTIFSLSLASVFVPSAPVIGAPAAGNLQASILFAAPLSNGGSPITAYTATCVNGANSFAVSRAVSPITITGLLNGTTYTCSVTAANAVGVSAPSESVNATPDAAAPLTLVNVQSRKTHTGVGAFDIDIAPAPLSTDPVTVEPRTIGSGHLIVFQFNNLISNAGTVTAIDAVTMATIAGVTSAAAGNDVAVTVAGVTDNRRIRITIDGMNGVMAPTSASLGFLVGDVNNTRSVNSSDISGVKARSGQTTTALNFKFDANASGAINSSDISAVKARSGLVLP